MVYNGVRFLAKEGFMNILDQINKLQEQEFSIKESNLKISYEQLPLERKLTKLKEALEIIKEEGLNAPSNMLELISKFKDKISHLQTETLRMTSLLQEVADKLYELRKEYTQSQKNSRDNERAKINEGLIIHYQIKLKQARSRQEHKDLIHKIKHLELEIAFSTMPQCSEYGANVLSAENSVKFIDCPRSQLTY